MTRTGSWTALSIGLALSGVAGIVNQVVWQRALKIVLGGSETLSSMIVVLVFLAGLGLGAALASRRAERTRRPMLGFAAVEATLAVVNVGVALLLALDISETVYGVQRVALGLGIPQRIVYAVGASGLLLLPTLLMGATVPLASEAAQRQLGAKNNSLVPVLFFINTVGAAGGALIASLWWLPWWGQTPALFGAVGLNALAAVVVASQGRQDAAVAETVAALSDKRVSLRMEEIAGAILGFASLGYEMLLFRSLCLTHGPLPTTFAIGLAAFLVYWSLGMTLSRVLARQDIWVGLLTGGGILLLPFYSAWDTAHYDGDYGNVASLARSVIVTAFPVLGFGVLYGTFVSRCAERWGRDVGRYSALNTLGSCLGVLFFTLVVYEAPLVAGTTFIAALLAGLAAMGGALRSRSSRDRRISTALAGGVMIVGIGVLVGGLGIHTTSDAEGAVSYWGRDGVVTIQADGDVVIDGLWHTRLTDTPDGHVGRPYTWVMAAAAVLAHANPYPKRALVIGAGVGVSGVTLAGVDGIQVDGYEINQTLRRVLEDRPQQTLHALLHPSLRWIWQDARTGLALDETVYDIILSAPLHLRQAGSSLLLSREYLRLVKSRLAEDGVLAVYSNEGPGAQSLLVQATLAEAFPFRTTWYDGVVTIASRKPITITPELLEARMSRDDLLYRQMRALDEELLLEGEGGFLSMWDDSDHTQQVADRVIVDDWPLVEYPEVANALVTAVEAP